MTILCTDKTGTHYRRVGAGACDRGLHRRSVRARALLAYLNATLETGFRNPIDVALCPVPAADADVFRKMDEIPYDFIRKRLSVAVSDGTGRMLITKGALPNVLDICTRRGRCAGGDLLICEDVRDDIEARFAALAPKATAASGSHAGPWRMTHRWGGRMKWG